jgi:hypothetical protein
MDPISIISIGATVIGGAVNMMGQMQQASASASAANYQAQVARNNQTIAEQNATYSRQAGVVEAEQQSQRTARLVGAEIAGQGASGIDPTTGSPAEVVKGTREMGRLDTLNLVQNAELRARGFNIEASNQGANAGLLTQQASNARTAGMFGAAGSLLTAGSSVADKWAKFQLEGVPGFGSSGTGGLY